MPLFPSEPGAGPSRRGVPHEVYSTVPDGDDDVDEGALMEIARYFDAVKERYSLSSDYALAKNWALPNRKPT